MEGEVFGPLVCLLAQRIREATELNLKEVCFLYTRSLFKYYNMVRSFGFMHRHMARGTYIGIRCFILIHC